MVVQCKRYGPTNKVGSQDLQRFGGTCYAVHGAETAVVVTTGEFTAPAAEYAAACGIVCVDADGLTGWSEGTLAPPWELPVAHAAWACPNRPEDIRPGAEPEPEPEPSSASGPALSQAHGEPSHLSTGTRTGRARRL